MTQVFGRKFLLQIDEPAVEKGNLFGIFLHIVRIIQVVSGQEIPVTIKIHLHIDAFFLQAVNEIILPIHDFRIQGAGVFPGIVDLRFTAPSPWMRIGRMQAHDIQAGAGQPVRDNFSIRFLRSIGVAMEVEPVKPDALIISLENVTILDSKETVLPCGSIQQPAEIQRTVERFFFFHVKWLFHGCFLLQNV